MTIATETVGDVYIDIPSENIKRTQTVVIGANSINLSRSLQKQGTFTDIRGIYLNSSVNVSVFVTNHHFDTTDTYTAMPLDLLGMHYVIETINPEPYGISAFMIVGVYDKTDILITSERGTERRALRRLEVYQESSPYAILRTFISSNKPVAVISGNTCANLVGGACDMTMTSCLPIKHFGKSFIVPTSFGTEKFTIKVLVISSTTDVVVNKNHYQNRDNASVIQEQNFYNPSTVTASKPVGVSAYIQSDPFVTTIPPVNHYRSKYVFAIPEVYFNFTQYISIVIPDAGIEGLRINNNIGSVLYSYKVPVPLNNYTVLVYKTTVGFHIIEQIDGVKFMVLALGTSPTGYGKYGYIVGFQTQPGKFHLLLYHQRTSRLVGLLKRPQI